MSVTKPMNLIHTLLQIYTKPTVQNIYKMDQTCGQQTSTLNYYNLTNFISGTNQITGFM